MIWQYRIRAHRSAVDRFLGMEEGRGSNPLESIVYCGTLIMEFLRFISIPSDAILYQYLPYDF